MTRKKSGIRDFFISVRLTIVLLSAIALGALLGTIIPQQEAAEAFSVRLHPAALSVFQAFQLFNVYHSAWFILLLLLLAVNLIACSLDRFPAAWRQFRGGAAPDETERLAYLPPERIVAAERPPAEEVFLLETLLRKRCGRVRRTETSQGFVLAGGKGAFSRFGVFVVHLGVLLLIAGGLAGAIFGVQGYVEIAEGETSNTLAFRGGKPSQSLPFSIRCDRFTVEHYEDGAPKLFRSDLTFIQDGKTVRKGALLVNHPIAFGGLRFYQSSYGVLPGGRLALSYARGKGKANERETAVGDRFALPGGEGEVEVLRAENDLMRMGPAVKLSVVSPRGEFQFWVFENIERIKEANPGVLAQIPLMNPALFAPYLFSMQKKGERFYTVLQAARDPGVPLVAGGAALLVVGLMITFFFSHRRFRIVLEEEQGISRIGLAGSSNRDPVGLEKEMNQLLAEIGKAEGRS
ncbi:MAG: cytochrome c biogenesis protein ResB [Deltaproteobacteria bacterium]|nr:cytochrome c biogenesis protein ResB [Deltaproteobacteria bacterium]